MALTDNIQAYWKLEETSGTRFDETANNNDLTDNNTVLYGTGIIGNGADFELTNSETLSITDASQTGLDFTGAFSVSMWVKPESLSGTEAIHGLVGKNLNSNRGWQLGIGMIGGQAYADATWYNSAGTRQIIQWSLGTFSAGTMYHLVFAMNIGSTDINTFDIYKNGVALTRSGTVSVTDIGDHAGDFVMGKATNTGIYTSHTYFDGIIDEVGIWSRVLSGTEITTLYNSGSGLQYPFTTTSDSNCLAMGHAF